MERGKIEIDFFTPEDNEAIIELSHRCIQEGMISVYPDRTPSFDRIQKQIDPESFHLVARQGDKLVGCVGVIYIPVQFDGEMFRAAYLMDFKVDPDYQRGLTAYRLVRAAADYLISRNEKIGFATIIKGNKASHIFTRGRAGFPGSENLGDIQVTNIIPLIKKKTDPRFQIGNPSNEDIGEIVELYNNFYKSYKLAPYIDEKLFRYYTGEIEGMDLSNFRVARENGRIKAILCSWDENIYKRYMVIRIPMGMKIVAWGIRVLANFLKMPASIRSGSPLRQKTLAMMAHDNSIMAMRSLIRHVNNIHLGSEYTVLQAHFHKDDPVIEALNGLLSLKVDIEAHMMSKDSDIAKRVAEAPGPVLFEWPLYI